MNPRFFNVNVDGFAPENSSPLFLQSADRGPIPLVLLADDDAGGSIKGRLGLSSGNFLCREN